ncbi:MAG: hypothetical protein AAF267_17485 [Deinococcota bacterium]
MNERVANDGATQSIFDGLELMVDGVGYLPVGQLLIGVALGFIVVFCYMTLRNFLKPALKPPVIIAVFITLVIIFINPNVFVIDWTLMSIYTGRFVNRLIFAIANSLAVLPQGQVDVWIIFGLFVGGFLAYRVKTPPKPEEFKWGGGGTLSKKAGGDKK